MKIKTKLLIGLAILSILTLSLLGIGWYQLLSIKNMAKDIKHNYNLSSLSHQIQKNVKDEAISLRNSLFFSDNELVQEEINTIQRLGVSVTQDILKVESMVSTVDQRFILEDLKYTNEQYNNYLNEVSKLISLGKKEEATRIVMDKGQQMQNDYFQVISKMTSALSENMNSSLNTMGIEFRNQMFFGSFISLLCMLISIAFVFRSVWAIAIRLNTMSRVMLNVASGNENLQTRIAVISKDEIDDVARSFNHMAESLEEQISIEQKLSKENQKEAWIKTNIADITTELNGMHELEPIARTFLSKVTPLMNACQAAFYLKGENRPVFELLASYAVKERKHSVEAFSLGEGLVGQAALEKAPILLTNVPADYIQIRSGLGEATPLNIYVLPIIYKREVIAVIEIASFIPYKEIQKILLDELVQNLGIILDSTIGRIKLARLLEESQVLTEELQAQSEELQSQQEELKAANEELESQSHSLQESEEKLQNQQEELEHSNLELREKAEILEVQNKQFEATNKEIENARAELEEKAKQLILSSKYKSEFLANMSHELRTPLNSLLILSKLLVDNHNGNLSDKQVEFSKTIYSSGCDLLNIINDILDLAKVESGKMEVHPSTVYLEDLAVFSENSFRPIASHKNIDFNIVINEGIPSSIYTDEQRLQQVLRNLLSNAFKFTELGRVTLEIGVADESTDQPTISFSITDTGIGIPEDKQELIFQAFQQADGTTSRKYGGTGLGLSICEQILFSLGGHITVKSEEGKGSTFTFYMSDYQVIDNNNYLPIMDEVAVSLEVVTPNPSSIENDDDSLTEYRQPSHFESEIPIRRLLIVDDDLHQRNSLMELIGDKNVILTAVSTGAEAIEELKVHSFDCIILDLGLSDTTGFELLEKIKSKDQNHQIHIVIYTGRDITTKDEIFLKRYAHTIIIKDAHSPERLINELELYLKSEADLSIQDNVEHRQNNNANDLAGKKVLLVDDDIRNVFALTNVLEIYGLSVVFAENGVEALKVLDEVIDIDVVLMDIMMPEMDGYETMRRLRLNPHFADLPIIALTAKAMIEDRELCMAAGASDYIVKPVIIDQLISLIRVWLYPQEANR